MGDVLAIREIAGCEFKKFKVTRNSLTLVSSATTQTCSLMAAMSSAWDRSPTMFVSPFDGRTASDSTGSLLSMAYVTQLHEKENHSYEQDITCHSTSLYVLFILLPPPTPCRLNSGRVIKRILSTWLPGWQHNMAPADKTSLEMECASRRPWFVLSLSAAILLTSPCHTSVIPTGTTSHSNKQSSILQHKNLAHGRGVVVTYPYTGWSGSGHLSALQLSGPMTRPRPVRYYHSRADWSVDESGRTGLLVNGSL
ncbi:unnamed protein product [Timema podura]|uniref:Uncharacterized protein n=1 Tax=Timema podura TaxID=61482 RepID=A0ABN7NI66_TIMPD|nr:unnamed protein product [Timema podura]